MPASSPEAPRSATPAVSLAGLSRSFGAAGRVLDQLDLQIQPGEFVALLGHSGSGKSTLLRILAGLDTGYEARAVQVPASVGVAFQEPRLMPWLPVWRNVVLNLPGDDLPGAARAALEEVGLAHKADVWPQTLSGGQAQRVSLARALARQPDLLLLDEPFGALDALTRGSMQKLVLELWRHHQPCVLLVTHDVHEAVLLADRVLVLEHGRITLDRRIDAPRPRRATDPALEALRLQLLAQLGVAEDVLI